MGARRPLLVDILARLGGILAASFQLVGGLFKPVARPPPPLLGPLPSAARRLTHRCRRGRNHHQPQARRPEPPANLVARFHLCAWASSPVAPLYIL